MKLSIIVPVYYNQETLLTLYEDIKNEALRYLDVDYEIIMIDDGSGDNSYYVMKKLHQIDSNVKICRLSRNFGSHSAILCGLSLATGDCAIVKAADLQEPSSLIVEMYNKWVEGYRVVLAVREGREDSAKNIIFANLYYYFVKRYILHNMPLTGFDVYLIDRKVIDVLVALDENNSALTGQILWGGFKTTSVYYKRLGRTIGKSRWTLSKKIKLVMDTLFSFSIFPIRFLSISGLVSVIGSVVWSIIELYYKLSGKIVIVGWTSLLIFNLFSFGMMMMALGIIGEYVWRIFDSSRKRPTFIIEENDSQP